MIFKLLHTGDDNGVWRLDLLPEVVLGLGNPRDRGIFEVHLYMDLMRQKRP